MDPFASIIEECRVSDSQKRLLDQTLFFDSDDEGLRGSSGEESSDLCHIPATPTEIFMCSVSTSGDEATTSSQRNFGEMKNKAIDVSPIREEDNPVFSRKETPVEKPSRFFDPIVHKFEIFAANLRRKSTALTPDEVSCFPSTLDELGLSKGKASAGNNVESGKSIKSAKKRVRFVENMNFYCPNIFRNCAEDFTIGSQNEKKFRFSEGKSPLGSEHNDIEKDLDTDFAKEQQDHQSTPCSEEIEYMSVIQRIDKDTDNEHSREQQLDQSNVCNVEIETITSKSETSETMRKLPNTIVTITENVSEGTVSDNRSVKSGFHMTKPASNLLDVVNNLSVEADIRMGDVDILKLAVTSGLLFPSLCSDR